MHVCVSLMYLTLNAGRMAVIKTVTTDDDDEVFFFDDDDHSRDDKRITRDKKMMTLDFLFLLPFLDRTLVEFRYSFDKEHER